MSVDIPLPHLDRPFDYRVPAKFAETATAGCRVRIRFAGQLVDGFILDRVSQSTHQGKLLPLERVVSPEPILSPAIARLARAVADRYAGTMADVLRLAVPPRHARVEREAGQTPAEAWQSPAAAGSGLVVRLDVPAGWGRYLAGAAWLRALRERRPARAVWSALPGEDWPVRVAEAVAATAAGDRGSVVIVPDARDLDRLDAAVTAVLGSADHHVALSAALGPAERYRRFLAASRGSVRIVLGTRAAAFAPVRDLGLVAIWDDGDDLHAEPRAPYPHARAVLLARAELAGAAALVAGYARTAEGQQLVATGWAYDVVAPRATTRARAPRVVPVGDDAQLARDAAAASARLPTSAWAAAREALATGAPVLIQVPRRGYIPAVSCARCGEPARCQHCRGPLALSSATAPPACRWCARPAAAYTCPYCGARALRAAVIGARRTAEELARAFPGVPVRTSGRDGILATVPAAPALVITTPGAEPVAAGGYGAILLLDTWAMLTRADLRAAEEALRRWLAAAALAKPAREGGSVVVVCDGRLAAVQALLRFDPGWFAANELAQRRELGFPPAVRMATVTGPPTAVAGLLAEARLPECAELLGPVVVGQGSERMLVRVPRSAGKDLAVALRSAAGVRSARKAPDPVRIQIDPIDLV
ncbi:MAG: primosomal protein N' [Micromonosporaceae bacterium]|nr:primosomal protein N' [Micromonosporaceae bacterium]